MVDNIHQELGRLVNDQQENIDMGQPFVVGRRFGLAVPILKQRESWTMKTTTGEAVVVREKPTDPTDCLYLWYHNINLFEMQNTVKGCVAVIVWVPRIGEQFQI